MTPETADKYPRGCVANSMLVAEQLDVAPDDSVSAVSPNAATGDGGALPHKQTKKNKEQHKRTTKKKKEEAAAEEVADARGDDEESGEKTAPKVKRRTREGSPAEVGQEREARGKEKKKRSKAPTQPVAGDKRAQVTPRDGAAPAGGLTPAAVSPCIG